MEEKFWDIYNDISEDLDFYNVQTGNLELEVLDDILDIVKLGAIQLTLTLGANSAAKASVNPSIAPLEEEIIV